MKDFNKYPKIILPLVICGSVILVAEEPRLPLPRYYSEVWRGGPDYGSYPQEFRPDSGLFATVDLEPNEQVPGYPYHSGIVEGVSDTIVVVVNMYNHNKSNYDISTYQPDKWFTPVIYEIHVDPKYAYPVPEPGGFGYSFRYWRNWFDEIVTQPDEIFPELGGNVQFSLVYYVWGLPAGRWRLMMKLTDKAPPGFRLLLRQVPAVWITKPMYLADTLCAYSACFWRAFYYGNYNIASTWADSILKLNPTSIPGWTLKIFAYSAMRDSSATVTAMDSTLAILHRYGDPLLPDSADMDFYQQMWYKDNINMTTYGRWEQTTGRRGVHW